jgi:DNA-binding beta-propeller fold protein YncE
MAGQQVLYVANYFSDDISVIDVTKLAADGNLDGTNHYVGLIQLVTHFPNPNSKGYHIAPRGIAFTPDGKYALILATETGSIIIVDAIHHKQIAELAPIDEATAGRPVNVRHIVISKDGHTAYLSHMRGNAVSRIDIRKLLAEVEKLPNPGTSATLPAKIWSELFVPFQTPQGPKNLLILEDYPKDHPNFAGKKWPYAHPNTIVLDPIQNRYLYVSSRTTTVKDDSRVDANIKGKIDVIDTQKGQVIFSFVGGAQPTALEVSRDGSTLISGALIDNRLFFFDLKKVLQAYNP